MPKPRSSKSTLFQVLNNAQCPLYVLNAQGEVLFANEPLCNWLGLDFEQIQMSKCSPSTEPLPSQPDDAIRGLAIPPSAYHEPFSRGKVFRTAADRHLIWRAASFIRLDGNQDMPGNVLAVLHHTDEDGSSVSESPNPWLRQLLAELKNSQTPVQGTDRFIGTSTAAKRINEQIAAACQLKNNLLITGPFGAGIEDLASVVHANRHLEQSTPITKIHCAMADAPGIQNTIVQSQGTRGQRRAGDWFMLIEPEKLTAEAANELNGFLQLPRHNLNFISISSQPEQIDPRIENFLTVMKIDVTPLLDRKSDIPVLASYFLKLHCKNDLIEFDKAAQQMLIDYDWPDDIRELEQTITAIDVNCECDTLSPEQLPDRFIHALQAQQIGATSVPVIELDAYLASIETELIERAMKQANHNKAKACKLLGISRAKLGRRIQVLGIGPDDSEPIIFEESDDDE